MHSKETLLSRLQEGGSVTLDGKTFDQGNKEGFDEAYDAAYKAYEARAALVDGKEGAPAAEPVKAGPEVVVAGDLATIDGKKFVSFETADGQLKPLQERNKAQADIIEALTKDPADVKRMDKAPSLALAKFEGVSVDGRANLDTIHKAILDKRGA